MSGRTPKLRSYLFKEPKGELKLLSTQVNNNKHQI